MQNFYTFEFYQTLYKTFEGYVFELHQKEQGFPLLFSQFLVASSLYSSFILIKTWTTNSPHGWYGATPITIDDVTFLP